MANKSLHERWKKAKELAVPMCESIRAQFPNLTMKLELESKQIDLMLEVPMQDNLQFDVCVYLSGDELYLDAGKRFHVSWFPCDKQEKINHFQQAVVGLMSGNYRVVEYYRGKCYLKAQLQRPEGEEWKGVATNFSVLDFPMFTPWWLSPEKNILQNKQGKNL